MQNRHTYKGPAFFSGGYRPFFFGAGLFALLQIALWITYVSGAIDFPFSLSAGWHAHEMLYGFVAAAVAGFALTAIPNWTGNLPLRGTPLALFFMIWLAGRVFMLFPSEVGRMVDSSFLILLTLFTGREIWVGKNWRNLPVVSVFCVFSVSNILVHLEQLDRLDLGGAGLRLGIATITILVSLIAGRIIPSFTENWLKKKGLAARPTPFNCYDKIVLIMSIIVFMIWVVLGPTPQGTFGFFILAPLHLIRLIRWQGWSVKQEPLLLVLHIAYLWLPISMLLNASEEYMGISNMGIHSLTTGAITSMIVAIMTRATLGHSGRTLIADKPTIIIFSMIWLAAACRILSFFMEDNYLLVLKLSGFFWIAGFSLFILYYSRYFFSRKS